MKDFKVYALLHPTTREIRYVGITTTSISRRMNAHMQCAHQGKRTHLYHWIRSLLAQGLQPTVMELDSVNSREDLCEAEQFWIASFRLAGADLCNHTDGGEGVSGYKFTEEDRLKVSNSLKGKKRSPEFCQKQRERSTGRRHTEQTKQKMKDARAGWKPTEEHKRNAAEGLRAFYKSERSQEEVKRRSERMKGRVPGNAGKPSVNRKAVVAVFEDGTVQNFESIRIAAAAIGVDRNAVAGSASGKRRNPQKGYRFYFEEDYTKQFAKVS